MQSAVVVIVYMFFPLYTLINPACRRGSKVRSWSKQELCSIGDGRGYPPCSCIDSVLNGASSKLKAAEVSWVEQTSLILSLGREKSWYGGKRKREREEREEIKDEDSAVSAKPLCHYRWRAGRG